MSPYDVVLPHSTDCPQRAGIETLILLHGAWPLSRGLVGSSWRGMLGTPAGLCEQ